MKYGRYLAVFATFWLVLAGIAKAEPRIALVVGNSGYKSVGSLDNPQNDAKLVAGTLEGLGFEVTLMVDASLAEFRDGVSSFGRALRAAGPEATGLFFYAGHGVQSFGANYLIPVDAQLTDAADLDLVAVEAQSILRQMSSARNRTNIVILDACRNNPFERLPDLDSSGLAEMKAPTGTFLAYATAPGQVALDGNGPDSPFTAALAAAMPTPGMPIEQMFKQVRVEVLKQTGGKQTPWDTSSLTSDFQFVADTAAAGEDALWESVSASRDPVQIMLYMRAYPDGRHFDDARVLLAEVMEAETTGAKPQPDKQPPEEIADNSGRATGVPDAGEQAAFNAAMEAGTVEAWTDFLRAYPDSRMREAAEVELAAAREKAGKDPDANPPGQDKPGAGPLTMEIFFDRPIEGGGEHVSGKNMAEIVQGSPLYPPIEGLPDEVWKGKHCADCHNWTKQALCDQGTFYVTNNTDDGLGPIHPLGGEFRRVLKYWAEQGCR